MYNISKKFLVIFMISLMSTQAGYAEGEDESFQESQKSDSTEQSTDSSLDERVKDRDLSEQSQSKNQDRWENIKRTTSEGWNSLSQTASDNWNSLTGTLSKGLNYIRGIPNKINEARQESEEENKTNQKLANKTDLTKPLNNQDNEINKEYENINAIEYQEIFIDLNNRILSLDPKEISTMDTSYISLLSNTTIEKFTPDQIRALTPEQISKLSAEQLNELDQKQIEALNIQQIKAINPYEIGKLRIISSFTKNQISSFTPEQIVKFTSNQIQQLTTEQFEGFTPNQIRALHHDAITAILIEQIKKLTDAQRVKALLTHTNLSEKQVQAINPEALAKVIEGDAVSNMRNKLGKKNLPLSFVDALTPEQAKAILDMHERTKGIVFDSNDLKYYFSDNQIKTLEDKAKVYKSEITANQAKALSLVRKLAENPDLIDDANLKQQFKALTKNMNNETIENIADEFTRIIAEKESKYFGLGKYINQKEITKLNGLIDTFVKEYINPSLENTAYTAKIALTTTNKPYIDIEQSSLKTDVRKEKETNTDAQKAIQLLKQEIAELNRKNQTAQQEHQNLSIQQLAEIERLKSALKDEKSSKETALTYYDQQVQKADKRIAELEEDLENTKNLSASQKTELKAQLAAAQEQARIAEEKIKAAEQRAQAAEDRVLAMEPTPSILKYEMLPISKK